VQVTKSGAVTGSKFTHYEMLNRLTNVDAVWNSEFQLAW